MALLIVDNGTRLPRYLAQLVGTDVQTIGWQKLEVPTKEKYDAIVLSGGSEVELRGHERLFWKEFVLAKETTTPLIGICFGNELLVEAFGGKLKKLARSYEGPCQITSLVSDPIFGDQSTFTVMEHHQWCADVLPKDFIALAQSDHATEIIRREKKLIYGFQFHPELDEPTGDGQALFHRALQSMIAG